MKIGFVVERPTQFEAPFYRFAARDPEHELRVLYTRPDPAAPVFDPELGHGVTWGIDLLGGYPHSLRPARHGARWLRRELREGYDLLVVNGYTRSAYLQAAALARLAGLPVALRIDSVRFADPPRRRLLKRVLFTTVLRPTYDLFLGVGSLSLDYLRHYGVPEERTGLFPYAVDVDDFRSRSALTAEERRTVRERLGVPPDARVILSLAKLNPRESPADLLAAYAILAGPKAQKTLPDTWLVLAGDGPGRADLERFAAASGLTQVRFPGYVPYPELPALYAAADLFVHAAREERWGVSVAEAMACGLPVVASSRVGAAHDLILSGGNGFLYRSGDAPDLAERLAAALALAPAAVRACNEEILSHWDYAAAWRGLLAAAAAVTARRPAHRRRS